MTEWGPEIFHNGKRPDGLADDDRVDARFSQDDRWQHSEMGGCYVNCLSWDAYHSVRLPADHPHYNKAFLTSLDRIVSGKNGNYYDITINGQTISCNDVIDALGLNFNHGELFKAAWRLGKKPGTSAEYDLDKIIYFANRERAKCQ